jgi:UDP-N-acetylmuramoylalanine-D-glutamate ligase
LAWRYLKDRPWVGITGTNGKTTTTALTAAIFQAAGLNAPACGNIGYAACELALAEAVPDWVIGELSSYQIEAAATLAPRIGLWTTFTPDHLARHKTLENYFRIKAQLLHQSELQVLNGDDPYLRAHVAAHFPDAHWTSIHGTGRDRSPHPLRLHRRGLGDGEGYLCGASLSLENGWQPQLSKPVAGGGNCLLGGAGLSGDRRWRG